MLQPLSLVFLAGLVGALMACKPVAYGVTADDALAPVLLLSGEDHEVTITSTADRPAQDGTPPRKHLMSLSSRILTADAEAPVYGAVWGGDVRLVEAESAQSTGFDEDGEESALQMLSRSLEPVEDCGWGDRCLRDLTRVRAGRSNAVLEVSARALVVSWSEAMSALGHAELRVRVDGPERASRTLKRPKAWSEDLMSHGLLAV
jgi:hypothetical protein